MPQANLETLVSACACGSCGTKVVCETLATREGDSNDRLLPAEKLLHEETPPDFPPESFLLSKDAELEWFDNNAFLERKDSQRRSSFSSSTNPNLNSVPSSQRFSLRKSKTSILGLPKPQNSCFVESKNRKNTGATRLFPKRSGSVKSDPPANEPTSPKVSCMGRVRSKRDRHRRLIKNRQNSAGAEAVKKKMTRTGSGFFSSFRAIFRCNGKAREKHALQSTLSSSSSRESDIRSRLPADDGDAADTLNIETKRESVSLGGMKRFASGRRSDPLI